LLTARHPVPFTTITPNEPGVVTAGPPPGHHATHRRRCAPGRRPRRPRVFTPGRVRGTMVPTRP